MIMYGAIMAADTIVTFWPVGVESWREYGVQYCYSMEVFINRYSLVHCFFCCFFFLKKKKNTRLDVRHDAVNSVWNDLDVKRQKKTPPTHRLLQKTIIELLLIIITY